MSNISQWNTAAASNNSAPPDGAPEGMAPSTVNDVQREMMAAVARQYSDTDGSLATTGTGSSYLLTTNNVHGSLADIGLLVFRVHVASNASPTLDVDGLGAKPLLKDGVAVAAGDLTADVLYASAYNATTDSFDFMNTNIGLGALAVQDTVNNDDWSGTALAVANGGTNATTAAAARASLDATDTSLSEADFSGLTAFTMGATLPGDQFLIMDGSTPKSIRYDNVGFPVNQRTGDQILDTDDLNRYIQHTGTGNVNYTLNNGVGQNEGNTIMIEQEGGSGQVTIIGTAQVNAAVGLKTRTRYSVITLIYTGGDVWTLTGDAEA